MTVSSLDPVPDPTPLVGPTRTALEWEGARWVEIDLATGRIIATGEVGHD